MYSAHVHEVPLPGALLFAAVRAAVHSASVLGLDVAAQVAGVAHAEAAHRAGVDLEAVPVRGRQHHLLHLQPQC